MLSLSGVLPWDQSPWIEPPSQQGPWVGLGSLPQQPLAGPLPSPGLLSAEAAGKYIRGGLPRGLSQPGPQALTILYGLCGKPEPSVLCPREGPIQQLAQLLVSGKIKPYLLPLNKNKSCEAQI